MNILAIGAHFDDIELGCGGALAKHVASGDTVYAYVATLSGFANPQNQVIRSNETALSEGQKAMDILGVELICGKFNTLEVEFAEALNQEILKIVEAKKIDKVYTHWVGDVHHDHQAVAKASFHSCRHVPNMLMYRSNWYPSNVDFKGNFYIDITDFWVKKEEALLSHESELQRTAYKWVSFFKNEAENAGQRIGVKYAEVYEMVKWLER
ncbi:PIG-L deacetylase family protein [Pelosinus sp. UFO1]|uniref:PIG-L deacetylase family protein n=1 Tax=Pelosinus sp. UFO1 TaxID=484770 RepID=UPI0004D19106|nr:PIG-L deacetylase family protein [Pelosinus sp. UFO1]AIF53638.1 LmbE family protein [Pelosinus sp. UFO1]